MAESDQAAPVFAEIAGAGFGDVIEPYVGELSYDPRLPSTYRSGDHDVSQEIMLYRDVLRDERAYSALSQRLDAAIAIPWEVQPGADTPRDLEAAESLTEQLKEFLSMTVVSCPDPYECAFRVWRFSDLSIYSF